jgi:hypothetical protein
MVLVVVVHMFDIVLLSTDILPVGIKTSDIARIMASKSTDVNKIGWSFSLQ